MTKVRTLKEIRSDKRVASIHIERSSDYKSGKSYWCYLNNGWQDSQNPTSHTIHEEKLSEVAHLVNNAIPYPNDPEL